MSVIIRKNMIIMTRGDSLRSKIVLKDKEGKEYIPIKGDKIRFALKHDYNDPDPLIIKEIPWDTMILSLDPQDTKKLNQPEDYVYDIQITLSNGFVDTFIPKGIFRITEEVE